MAILASEIKWYNPQVRNDTASNGGRMTATQNVSGVSENVWPHVPESERTAGSDKYRKLFTQIRNADNTPLYSARVYLAKPTPGDDILCIFAGTQTDVQDDLTGSEDLYGAGTLDEDLSGGEGTIDVLVEDWSNYPIFRDGDEIVIWKGAEANAPDAREFHVINGAPSPSGNIITLTLTGTIAGSYTDGAAWVASTLSYGDLQASIGTPVVTSASGTFDGDDVTAHNIGAVSDTITLTFTSATAFTAAGAAIGSLGSGSTLSNFAPTNAGTGTAYFTIATAAWGGTFASGDTVVYALNPASMPHWERRIVPAGAAAIAAFSREIVAFGETA